MKFTVYVLFESHPFFHCSGVYFSKAVVEFLGINLIIWQGNFFLPSHTYNMPGSISDARKLFFNQFLSFIKPFLRKRRNIGTKSRWKHIIILIKLCVKQSEGKLSYKPGLYVWIGRVVCDLPLLERVRPSMFTSDANYKYGIVYFWVFSMDYLFF
jgi:hypothetical protein